MRIAPHFMSLAAVLAATWLPQNAAAETAYVTDNLRLGLHQASDTSDRAFRTLESGQELEILTRDRNYANVRLPDGTVGFVKAAYLVFDKPAKLIVAQTQAEVERLQRQLDETRAAFKDPSAKIASLEQELATLRADASSSSSEIAELTAQVEDFRSRQGQFKYSVPITWVGGALFVSLLGGFLFGMWWVDNRSRKRHGGIRIY